MIDGYSMRLRLLLAAAAFIAHTISSFAQAPSTIASGYIENRGQWDQKARFLLRSEGLDLWIGSGEVMLDIQRSNRQPKHPKSARRETSEVASRGHVIRMTFVGADPASIARGADLLEGTCNYFVGEQGRWARDVPRFGSVQIENLYDGIDARFSIDGDGGNPRYDLIVSPGVDPAAITIDIDGPYNIHLAEEGDLEMGTECGIVMQSPPVAWQVIDGERRSIPCDFRIDSGGLVRFRLGEYDPDRTLVIDPLIYSTFVAGTGLHITSNSVIDRDGNIYLVGSTTSTDYPISTGAYQTANNKSDPGDASAFITKMNPTGTGLVFSTYIGGAQSNDNGFGIAIDTARNVFVVGTTNQTGSTGDYPVTSGAFQTARGGGADGFLSKLSSTGNTLVYSTFLGGPGDESVYDVAVDRQGNAIATGESDSTFPTTSGAYQRTRGGLFDGFATKLNVTGSSLTWSTLIGGSESEVPLCISVDSAGNTYIGGQTESSDFPTTSGAYDRTFNAVTDGFLAKLNPAGSALIYSTFVGSADEEAVADIIGNNDGTAVAAGWTMSDDFPTTNGAYSTTFNGGFYDGFLIKFNSTGASLLYSTYLGGSGDDYSYAVAIDSKGRPYVAGNTTSTDFPITLTAFDGSHNGETDLFVVKMNFNASGVLYSTYVGGELEDIPVGVGVDSTGAACIGGYTYSGDFPTTPGAFQTSTTLNAAFALKIPVPTLALLSPIGGEQWCTGGAQQIRWVGSGVDSVNIDISANGGLSWTNLAQRVPSASGAWTWQIPASWPEGAAYRIKISHPQYPVIGDTSRAGFTINRSPQILIPPVSITLCEGERASFNVVAAGSNRTYQWRRNGANIAGARDSFLVISSITPGDAGNYDVVVGGPCPPPVISNSAALTINAPPRITSQPGGDTICSGEPARFSVTATGTALTYQWQRNGVDIDGARSATLSMPAADAGAQGLYRVVISGACAPPDTSMQAPLLVLPIPEITEHPTDTVLCAGGNVDFHVSAPGLVASYQWRKNGVDIPGATDSILTISHATFGDGGEYDVAVSGGLCSTFSNPAFLGVRRPPAIVEQPADAVACSGGSGSIALLVEGDDLSYQWRRGGVELPGKTGPSLDFEIVTPADTGYYDVVVHGACEPPVISDPARLSLSTSTTISITSQPHDTTMCQGERLVLRVRATGASLKYQWRRNGAEIPNAIAPTLTVVSVSESDAGAYDVALSSSCGAPANSQIARVAVNSATSITGQPRDTAVHAGARVTFAVDASGRDLGYQWTKNGSIIPGATERTITIDPVTDADSGTYSVIVTGVCGSSTSRHAALTILAPASTPVVGVFQPDIVTFQVIPHPAGGITQLIITTGRDLSREERVGLYLYDLVGRRVMDLTRSFEEGERRVALFDASRLAAGIYICRLATSAGERTIGMVVSSIVR